MQATQTSGKNTFKFQVYIILKGTSWFCVFCFWQNQEFWSLNHVVMFFHHQKHIKYFTEFTQFWVNPVYLSHFLPFSSSVTGKNIKHFQNLNPSEKMCLLQCHSFANCAVKWLFKLLILLSHSHHCLFQATSSTATTV